MACSGDNHIGFGEDINVVSMGKPSHDFACTQDADVARFVGELELVGGRNEAISAKTTYSLSSSRVSVSPKQKLCSWADVVRKKVLVSAQQEISEKLRADDKALGYGRLESRISGEGPDEVMDDLVGLNKLNKENGGLESKEITCNSHKEATKIVCNPNRAVVEEDQVVGGESFERFELPEFQVSPKKSKRKERKFGSLFALQDKDHLGDNGVSVLGNEVSILEVEGYKNISVVRKTFTEKRVVMAMFSGNE
ncbi:hypothetical protein V6N11_009997 [Hibiscus sabdariffa]|uniref:Uncharacterized protein n=1 Tax=Hibiscus sabdariffa TaxID=183260 RepID=A0ABR2PDB4_9ROSI